MVAKSLDCRKYLPLCCCCGSGSGMFSLSITNRATSLNTHFWSEYIFALCTSFPKVKVPVFGERRERSFASADSTRLTADAGGASNPNSSSLEALSGLASVTMAMLFIWISNFWLYWYLVKGFQMKLSSYVDLWAFGHKCFKNLKHLFAGKLITVNNNFRSLNRSRHYFNPFVFELGNIFRKSCGLGNTNVCARWNYWHGDTAEVN